MKLDRTIKRFTNLKLVVTKNPNTRTSYTVINPVTKVALQFCENGEGSNYVGYFTAKHPETNASYDLFMDSYFHSVKSAISYLTNPASE